MNPVLPAILAQAGLGGEPFSKVAGDAAVFLIVGGLCMLGLVVVLVVLRTVFPSGRPRTGVLSGRLGRELLPTPTLKGEATPSSAAPGLPEDQLLKGRRAGEALRPAGIDDIMDAIVKNAWGDPRVLRFLESKAVIRYYHCADCKDQEDGQGGAVHGCGFQAGFLRGAFSRLLAAEVQVRELACLRQGGGACEFEVRYA